VELDVRGNPLHSRALSITLRRGEPGRREVQASLLDLRKRGFVPVGGDLQSSGIVHHMQIAGSVEEERLVLERVELAQPAVAFEPSAASAGESCRDPAGRLQALVGAPLDAGFPRRLGAEIGAERGCTHVLTLAQLVGSTLPWVREREARLFAQPPAWRRGERIFRRDLVFDGFFGPDGRLRLAAQLLDLHLRAAPEPPRPMDRFGAQLELRLLAEVDPQTLRLVSVRAAERRRGLEDLEHAAWRDLAGRLEGLEGLALRAGVSAELLRHQGDPGEERPLLEVLLHLTPAAFQCLATLDEHRPLSSARQLGVVGMGGPPGSCYMWRTGGALDARRQRESGD